MTKEDTYVTNKSLVSLLRDDPNTEVKVRDGREEDTRVKFDLDTLLLSNIK